MCHVVDLKHGFVTSRENVLFTLENIGTCVKITWNYFSCVVLHKVKVFIDYATYANYFYDTSVLFSNFIITYRKPVFLKSASFVSFTDKKFKCLTEIKILSVRMSNTKIQNVILYTQGVKLALAQSHLRPFLWLGDQNFAPKSPRWRVRHNPYMFVCQVFSV